jgi:polyvinyl alcohol dehydrogenase (cytochrome)
MSRVLRVLSAAALLAGAAVSSPAAAQTIDAEQLFKNRCAMCHEQGLAGAPARAELAKRAPEMVVHALSEGVMAPQADGLSKDEIAALAAYVTAKLDDKPAAGAAAPATTPKP